MNTLKSVFKDPSVARHLSELHYKYVVVTADKDPNSIAFVCKSYYIDCLKKDLVMDSSLAKPTYTQTSLTKEEILDNHWSVFVFL